MSKRVEIETERTHRIWDNGTGEPWEVGPDRNRAGLVEITRTMPNEEQDTLVLPPAVAVEVARVITQEFGEPQPEVQGLISAIRRAKVLLQTKAPALNCPDVDQAVEILTKAIDTEAKD